MTAAKKEVELLKSLGVQKGIAESFLDSLKMEKEKKAAAKLAKKEAKQRVINERKALTALIKLAHKGFNTMQGSSMDSVFVGDWRFDLRHSDLVWEARLKGDIVSSGTLENILPALACACA